LPPRKRSRRLRRNPHRGRARRPKKHRTPQIQRSIQKRTNSSGLWTPTKFGGVRPARELQLSSGVLMSRHQTDDADTTLAGPSEGAVAMWLSTLTNPIARRFPVPPIVPPRRGPMRPGPCLGLATDFSSINMPTTIDLASLRYTILAADHRSFRAAALTLGVRSSVISRRIRDLEDTIGVSIFERFSGGIRLTDAGAEFVGAIRRALDDIDAAISTAGTAGLGGSGRLKIGFCGVAVDRRAPRHADRVSWTVSGCRGRRRRRIRTAVDDGAEETGHRYCDPRRREPAG